MKDNNCSCKGLNDNYNSEKKTKVLRFYFNVTHGCNLNCKYCYDTERRHENPKAVMKLEDFGKAMKLASQFANEIEIHYIGGEPTVIGMDWFVKAQEVLFKNVSVQYKQIFQTNSILIDEEWIEMLKKYNMSVSTSYDGESGQVIRLRDKDIDIEEKIRELKCYGVPTGAVACINNSNFRDLINIFKKYDELGIGGNFRIMTKDDVPELIIPTDEYLKSFRKYFEFWLYQYKGRLRCDSVLISYISSLIDGGIETWAKRNCQDVYISMEPNGDIYPCTSPYSKDYCYGNINDIVSLEDAFFISKGRKNLDYKISEMFKRHCGNCDYAPYCFGEGNCNYTFANDYFSNSACDRIKGTLGIIYDLMRDIDLFDDSKDINLFIKEWAKKNRFFTIKEIQEFLPTIGYNQSLLYDRDDFINCQEFKVWKIFNYLDLDTNIRVIQITPQSNSYNFSKQDRMNTLRQIYFKYIEDIHGILND